jgi:hypothetical protein
LSVDAANGPVLFLAFELSEKSWKLGFTTVTVRRSMFEYMGQLDAEKRCYSN